MIPAIRYFHSKPHIPGLFYVHVKVKEMNLEALAPYFLTGVVGVIGWFVRVLWEADKELREGLSKLREDLPRQFVMREDYRRDIFEIKELLKEIRAGLDGKADK